MQSGLPATPDLITDKLWVTVLQDSNIPFKAFVPLIDAKIRSLHLFRNSLSMEDLVFRSYTGI